MSILLSSWSKNVQAVPANYVYPQEKRPGDVAAPVWKGIPVIDLAQVGGLGRDGIIQQIMKATQDIGIFQVINHGVAEQLMDETMSVFKEFFDLPVEDKAMHYSEDVTKSFRLYTSGMNYLKDEVNDWKDSLQHNCHPLKDNIQFWPEKPSRYREVVGAYSVEVIKLNFRILDLICEGLGVEHGYFENQDELSKTRGIGVNHYPPCPDPSLVMGIGGHCDPNLLTLLQQEVYGLQFFKDGQWVGVQPLPHAFVVNVCNQLEMITNGKLKSAQHRAVANKSVARTSIGTYLAPSLECVVEPAKALVSASDPQLFKAIRYKEFVEIFMAKTNYGTSLEAFKLQV